MLLIKCGSCKSKIWKYQKFGKGEVLRCHKKRITKTFQIFTPKAGEKIHCSCGTAFGIDKGSYIKMIAKSFTYSGKKIQKKIVR